MFFLLLFVGCYCYYFWRFDLRAEPKHHRLIAIQDLLRLKSLISRMKRTTLVYI